MSDYRPLSPREERLLRALLARDFPGASYLRPQLDHVLAKSIDLNGSLEFEWPSNVIPVGRYRGVPVEATYTDSDGCQVHVLLHVVDRLFSVLEVFREDGEAVKTLPDATDALEVLTLPSPP